MGLYSIRGHFSTGGPLWGTVFIRHYSLLSPLSSFLTDVGYWSFQVIRRAHVMSKVLDGDGEKRRKLRAFATEMSSLCDSDLIKMVI